MSYFNSVKMMRYSGNSVVNDTLWRDSTQYCNGLQTGNLSIFRSDWPIIFETRREKTGFLHMRKQRRRSASR